MGVTSWPQQFDFSTVGLRVHRMTKTPYLTKSRYMNGLSCDKMLWLGWHNPLPYSEPEHGSPQEVGTVVGRCAQLLFPGGVLVDEAPWEHDLAAERTRDLMADPEVPAIFEAAYEYGDIRIRADIIERLADDTWGLREVKSSSRVKQSYVDDVGVQLYVLQGLGIDVPSVELIHINTAYIRGDHGIHWPSLFNRADITQEAIDKSHDAGTTSAYLLGVLIDKNQPDIIAGRQCPKTCDYWDHCTTHMPEDWIYRLPRLSAQRFEELRDQGIEAIRDIPEDYKLNPTQKRVRKVWLDNKPYISGGLSEALEELALPAYYLDFETMSPAIPLYSSTRPFQRIPFQWSLHHVDGEGKVTHDGFLAPGATNPILEFATTLINALAGTDGPIVVYSSFEKSTLADITNQYPDLADNVQAIIDRLVDLLPIVRKNTYLRDYHGSFSIKTVAPALAPHLSYKELVHVADGLAASAAFERIVSSEVLANEDATTLRASLLEYCKLDTLAMVETHVTLRKLCKSTVSEFHP
jgi:hypothetical protein